MHREVLDQVAYREDRLALGNGGTARGGGGTGRGHGCASTSVGRASSVGGARSTDVVPNSSTELTPTTRSWKWHAARCAGESVTYRSGSCWSQISWASGQRGVNGQPGGRFTSEGGDPTSGLSRSRPVSSNRGRLPSRASV